MLAEGVDIDVTQNVTISVFSRGEIRYGTYIINGQCFVYTFMVAPAGFGLVEYTVVGITPCSGSSDAGYEGGGGGGDPVPGDSGGGYEVPGSPVNTIPGIPTGHNGWGGGGSGSGNGNNNTPPAELTDAFGNPVLTVPLLKDPHIKELNKITNQNPQGTNELRNKIDEYVGLLDTAQEENGIMYIRNTSGSYDYLYPTFTDFDKIEFPYALAATEVIIHFHHNFVKPDGSALAPIPSSGDITGFAKSFNQMGSASARNNLTSIVVTRNGLYAFRVTNSTTLSTASDSFNNPIEKKDFEDFFEKQVMGKAEDEAEKKCTENCTEEIYNTLLDTAFNKYFIEFMNKTDMGIGIYKGELNAQTGNYNWIKITN